MRVLHQLHFFSLNFYLYQVFNYLLPENSFDFNPREQFGELLDKWFESRTEFGISVIENLRFHSHMNYGKPSN